MNLLSFGDNAGGLKLGKLKLPKFGGEGKRLKIRWFKSAEYGGIADTSWRTDRKALVMRLRGKDLTHRKIKSAINANGRVWNSDITGAIRRQQAGEYVPTGGVVTTLGGMDPEEWGLEMEEPEPEDAEHDSVWDLAAPLGNNANDNPGYQDWDNMTIEEIRERCRSEVLALAQHWPQANAEQRLLIEERLEQLLGKKYLKLLIDFLESDTDDDLEEFVTVLVEAAVLDGGREPIVWKIQRAIRRLFNGVQSQTEVRGLSTNVVK